jgi:protein involved in polysaccharide export with SLBB domain
MNLPSKKRAECCNRNVLAVRQAPMLDAAYRLLALFTILSCGCAALTNPVANGIPVRLVPDELLADPKVAMKPIPLTWLRTATEDTYRLAPGDVLGVFIDGVLGEPEQLPPVYYSDLSDQPPSIGFPIPVRENGTVPLPLIDPVKVEGLTMAEAEKAILRAYTVDKEIIRSDESRTLVTLISPRKAKILVIREDSPNQRIDNSNNLLLNRAAPIQGSRGQGTGQVLELPATEADLLSVLARSGGLPGPNAANEIIIQRGYNRGGASSSWPMDGQGNYCAPDSAWCRAEGVDEKGRPRQVRIPLRWRCEDEPPICPEDVRLESGDIVFVPADDSQVYYTGGLLPSREVGLPRDVDLGVVEALLRVGGPLVNGGINANNLSGGIVGSGIGAPSPSLLTVLRRTPDGGQAVIRVDLNRALRDPRENMLVKAGDVLILQETEDESITRYLTTAFDFNILFDVLRSGSATITGSGSLP